MPDREKVIKALENAEEISEGTLIMSDQFRDVLIAMLKEQDAVEPEWRKGTPFCRNCGRRLEKKNRNMDGIKCPLCGRSVKWDA